MDLIFRITFVLRNFATLCLILGNSAKFRVVSSK